MSYVKVKLTNSQSRSVSFGWNSHNLGDVKWDTNTNIIVDGGKTLETSVPLGTFIKYAGKNGGGSNIPLGKVEFEGQNFTCGNE